MNGFMLQSFKWNTMNRLAASLAAVFLFTAAATACDDSPSTPAPPVLLVSSERPAITEGPDDELKLDGVRVSADRPAWIGSEPVERGEVHRFAIESDPCFTGGECRRDLQEKVREAVNGYIDRYFAVPGASQLLRVSDEEIEERLIRESFEETIQVSFGDMQQRHALLEFDEDFRLELEDRWQKIVAGSRLAQVGLYAAAIFAGMLVVFGYLRADTRTRGYWSGRLRLAALTALVLVGLAGWYAGRYIDWL